MNAMVIPISTLFSTWVFIWAVAFYFAPKNRFSTYWNPFASLCLALSYQIVTFFIVMFQASSQHVLEVLVKVVLISAAFKAGPMYVLWRPDIPWTRSIMAGSALFVIYYIYIRFRGLEVLSIYQNLTDAFVKNDVPNRMSIM